MAEERSLERLEEAISEGRTVVREIHERIQDLQQAAREYRQAAEDLQALHKDLRAKAHQAWEEQMTALRRATAKAERSPTSD